MPVMPDIPNFQSCSRCGHTPMTTGRLKSDYGIMFAPDDVPFMILGSSTCKVTASMCAKCGHIELTGDTEKLSKLIGEGVHES